MVNMAGSPWPGWPTSSARAPSNSMVQVGEPWMPSLCSIPPGRSALGWPRLPSAPTSRLGATNREMPRTPSGASGRRASTRCTMFSAQSWSPQVM